MLAADFTLVVHSEDISFYEGENRVCFCLDVIDMGITSVIPMSGILQ